MGEQLNFRCGWGKVVWAQSLIWSGGSFFRQEKVALETLEEATGLRGPL